ncbi:MAG: hypothetical protein ACRDHL_15785 [Candidatus Promineifilaceae bacterium]
MDNPEETAHAFIIRIWLEEREGHGRHAIWRGHIIHVPSNERALLSRLDEIGAFITPYLRQLGVEEPAD